MKKIFSYIVRRILPRILAISGAVFVITLAISYICPMISIFFPTQRLVLRNICLDSLSLSMYAAIPTFVIFIILQHQRN